MKDTKKTPQSEWEQGDFYLHVALNHSLEANAESFPVQKAADKGITVLEIKDMTGFVFNAPHDHADIMQVVFQWLRDVDANTRMKFIAGLVLEHQISYHLNAKTEEERLQSANMEEDGWVEALYQATKDAVDMGGETLPGHYVEVSSIYKLLDERHMALPPYVVYTVLKTLEWLDGRLIDVGEGFFSVRGKL